MRLPGTETIVNSWAELVGELHSREIIPVREDEGGHLRSPYVFRGADSAKWPLETSIVRLPGFIPSNSKTVERSLIRSFRKYAKAGTFDDKSEWYVLAVAQHNGLPTRCLDWCASPFVAAHFACSDETRKSEDGVIWCLHAGYLRAINREHHQSTRTLDPAYALARCLGSGQCAWRYTNREIGAVRARAARDSRGIRRGGRCRSLRCRPPRQR